MRIFFCVSSLATKYFFNPPFMHIATKLCTYNPSPNTSSLAFKKPYYSITLHSNDQNMPEREHMTCNIAPSKRAISIGWIHT